MQVGIKNPANIYTMKWKAVLFGGTAFHFFYFTGPALTGFPLEAHASFREEGLCAPGQHQNRNEELQCFQSA